LVGAVIIGVLADQNISARAIAEAGKCLGARHAIAGTAIFTAYAVHAGAGGAFAVVIAIEPVV
jgi:hypothetical protein